MKVLLAGALTPCIRAYEHLLAYGIRAEDVQVMTHDFPANAFVLEFLRHRQAVHTTAMPQSRGLIDWARKFSPDLLLSFYYRKKVPVELLEIPGIAAVNLHPSLLPKYRGGFSAPWAIINGESVTGITYHYMVEEFDAGKIVLQDELPILPHDTSFSLYHKQVIHGLSLFERMMARVVEQRTPGQAQTGDASSYSRKLPNGGYIDTGWPRERTDRFIRAMYFPPHKGAMLRMEDGREIEVVDLGHFDSLMA